MYGSWSRNPVLHIVWMLWGAIKVFKYVYQWSLEKCATRGILSLAHVVRDAPELCIAFLVDVGKSGINMVVLIGLLFGTLYTSI